MMKKFTGNILITFAFIISICLNVLLLSENSKINEYKQELTNKESIIVDLKEEIDNLNNNISLAKQDTRVNNDLIFSMEKQIETLKEQIKDKNREINFLYNKLD